MSQAIKKNHKYFKGVLSLAIFILLAVTLFSVSADKIIGFVGSNNAYVVMFLLALVGSISTFASIPYPITMMSLAAGGLNPLLLGLVSGVAVICTDMFTFRLTQSASYLVPERISSYLNRISEYTKIHPRLLTPFLYFYALISPVSNDFAVISLSLLKYPFWRVILPLGMGTLTYNVGIAYLGYYAYDIIASWF